MQAVDDLLFSMIVSTTVVVLLSILFIGIIYRHLKFKATLKKELFESIYLAQEEERARIAMDLHDDLGSLLIAIKLNLENSLHGENKKTHTDEIQEIIVQVTEAIKITRSTSQILMPESLTKYGLNSALRELFNRFGKALAVSFEYSLNDSLHHFLEINIYRIICELISNAVKHSNATQVDLSINTREDKILITFVDNGKGFDFQQQIHKNDGIGLNNIKNRVAFLKGTLKYANINGSKYEIIIPKQ